MLPRFARAAAVALAAAAMPAAVAAAAEPGDIVVRTSLADFDRERLLVDALRIYMRDLGRAVRLGGPAPATLRPDELARVVGEAQRDGDDVVVWFGGGVLYALRVSSADLRETAVAAADPFGSARALALKVRALLTRATDERWTVPRDAPPSLAKAAPSAPPPSATPTPTPSPPPRDPPSLPLASATVTRALPRPTTTRLELAAAYSAVIPTRPEWTRQGVTLRLTVPLGHLPLAAYVDGGLGLAPALPLDGGSIGARVWPLGLGLAARLSRPRFRFAVGPRVSLQIVEANAIAPDGRRGEATTLSAGLGLHAEGAWLFSRHVGAFVTVGGEALLPRQQFASAGPTATDLGWAQLELGAGLSFALP